MLTKADKKWIEELVIKTLTRTVVIERGPRKQGDPEKVIKEEEWNMIDYALSYPSRIEAALRGVQEDVDKMKNRIAVMQGQIQIVGDTLIAMEENARKLAMLSDRVEQCSVDSGLRFTPIQLTEGSD